MGDMSGGGSYDMDFFEARGSRDRPKRVISSKNNKAINDIDKMLRSSEGKNIDLAFSLIQDQGIDPNQVPYVVEMLDLNDWLNRYGEGFSGNFAEIIKSLISMEDLSLNNNQLTELPQSIGKLTSLKRLSLNNNQLTNLPKSIGKLTALEELWVTDNQLTYLPQSIGWLTELKWFYSGNNQLTYLPQNIGNLTSLVELHLQNNQLTELPQSIGNLTSLKHLRLQNNQLSEFEINSIKSVLHPRVDFLY